MGLRDFALATVIVLLFNFVTFGEIDRRARNTPRRLTHRVAHAEATALAHDETIDLVILGDSRAATLPAHPLCALLPGAPERCANWATNAGDWVTALSLFRALEEHLVAESIVLLGVSDYWLEGGRASSLELIPRSDVYAVLGDPLESIASFVPLSTDRGGRMRWIRKHIEALGERVAVAIGGPDLAKPEQTRKARLTRAERSNVDAWFAPIDEPTRQERIDIARRALAYMTHHSQRVVLMNLPNSEARRDYVDTTYPKRRERFLSAAAALAREFEVPFIDLTGTLDARHHYRDYHHIKSETERALTELVARALGTALADGDTPVIE